MSASEMQSRLAVPVVGRAKQIGKGLILAGAIAALSMMTAPATADAHDNGVGAAIGLGVLGGVIAGAAIASSAPPVYGAPPPPAYDYPPPPPQGYYAPAPAYYPAPQPYYGWAPYR